MAMEQLELTDAQAQTLLDSPSPLADVYRYFEKLETGYMDVIRDSIESRADDVCRAQEELRTAPLYLHSAAYASEHGEMAQYNRSYQAIALLGVAVLLTCSLQNGIILLVMAFLISPFGLPMAAIWLLGKVQDLKFAIQDLVYG